MIFFIFLILKNIKTRLNFQILKTVLVQMGLIFDKKLFEQCPDNVNIYGYFQSYEYFKNIKEEIKEDFSFKNKFIRSAKKFLILQNQIPPYI